MFHANNLVEIRKREIVALKTLNLTLKIYNNVYIILVSAYFNHKYSYFKIAPGNRLVKN